MLTIKNWDKLLGDNFVNDRFLCSNYKETSGVLSFWFKDLMGSSAAGGIWIEIDRTPVWNEDSGVNLYYLKYPNGREHRITADWFSDIDNARWTFEEALKQTIV